ncbi:hypothetical protein V3C99_015798 [Haemonchus contortus]|uniref:Uncharacterized protein n=1 Tax=Haemonchus contortus TaxID=6289 RepID=A0A7I5ECU6_HAECO
MINADNIGGSSESDSEEGRLDDSAVLRGVDAKQLRDATSAAITNVWKEATLQTTALARKITVGSRLDALPTIAMLGLEPQTSRITPFSGTAEEGTQFSVWLRRLEDVIRMRPRPSPLSSEPTSSSDI